MSADDQTAAEERVAELEERLAALEARLDAQAERDDDHDDGPTMSRRAVLGGLASAGVLGGVAGGAGRATAETGIGPASASLGEVHPGVRQWADPGGFAGPDAAKSNIPHSVGQVYHAQDSGRRYYDDGSEWDDLPVATGMTKRVASGGDLADEINGALGEYTTLQVARPTGTNSWTFDQDLTFNPIDYDGGIEIVFDKGVEVEYTGSGRPFDLDTGGGAGSVTAQTREGKSFTLKGGIWTASGTPTGFFRGTDINQAVIHPHIVRESWAGTFCELVVDAKWCEDNHIGGNVIDVDTAINFNGDNGTASFADCSVSGVFGASDYGIRASGLMRGVETEWNFFPRSGNAVGVELDGTKCDGWTFINPRFDNVGDHTSPTPYVLETTTNYTNPGPMFVNFAWSGAAEWQEANYFDAAHLVYRQYPFNSKLRFEAFGTSTGALTIHPDGGLVIEDDTGTETTRITSNGRIQKEDQSLVPFLDTAYLQAGWRNDAQSSPFVGSDQMTVYMSDGTDSYTAGDVVVRADVGGTTLEEVISPRSSQS
jgi:hypothetical protein